MKVRTRKFCEATKVAEIHRWVYDFDLDVCDMTLSYARLKCTHDAFIHAT